MIDPSTKFVAIVGPTATGKTGLAIALAQEFNGEIVCADSRTIYRGMDIGTAKPTAEERALVPHHLLDIVDPGERLSSAEFKRLADTAINEIAGRGRLPILVGGSGLYVDAVLFAYEFGNEADPERRGELDILSDEQLRMMLAEVDAEAFARVDLGNRRRVIRAIETVGDAPSRRAEMIPQALVLGTTLNKEFVQKRIEKRIEKMLEEGIIREVRTIGETYGWESSALEVVGYRAFTGLVLGTKTLEQARADCLREHMAIFKKQVTWFKRHEGIKWTSDTRQAEGLVREFLGTGL